MGVYRIDQLPLDLARRVEVLPFDCWQWTGAKTAAGYGSVTIARTVHLTHRLVYELLVGPIPTGLHVDHGCRNRACCNPRHLEAVTPQVNVLRGTSPAAAKARQTHCVHGHEFTDANTYRCTNGTRRCRKCLRRHQKERRARRRAEGKVPS